MSQRSQAASGPLARRLCLVGGLVILAVLIGRASAWPGGPVGALAPQPPTAQGPLLDRAKKAASLYSTVTQAANPEQLHLLNDGKKLVGWVSGVKDQAGQEVK